MQEGDPNKITPEALGIKKTATGISIPEKTIEKVVTNDVTIKKKNKLKKISETFFGGTPQDAVKSVLMDVLIPALKQTLYDMISTGSQRLLFGNTVANGRPVIGRPITGGRVNYAKQYTSSVNSNRTISRITAEPAQNHDFNQIMYPTRADAENVLSKMYDLINEYGQATVANLYQLSGVTTSAQDYDWGWSDVRRSRIIGVQNGMQEAYIIDFPQPGVIKR